MTSNWAPMVLCMNPFIYQASHYPAVRTLAVRSYSSPHILQYYGDSLLVVASIHITAVPLILTLLPNPWRPESP